jgi:transketolase
MNAVKYELDNLVAIVDRNFVQLAGTTEDIMDMDIEALWRAAGWDVAVLEDGNDVAGLLEAIEGMRASRDGKPHMIIANTTKGKGISFMEGSLSWHARPMDEEQYHRAIAELENAGPA